MLRNADRRLHLADRLGDVLGRGQSPARLPLCKDYVAQVIADTPYSYHKLNDADAAATIVDSSGNGRNGTGTVFMRADSPRRDILPGAETGAYFAGSISSSFVDLFTLDWSAQTGGTLEVWTLPANSTQSGTRTFEIWINGVLDKSDATTFPTGTMNTTTGGLRYAIGRNAGTVAGGHYKGLMGHAAIYVAKLSKETIRQHYLAAGYTLP
jgi:hypothetical protein